MRTFLIAAALLFATVVHANDVDLVVSEKAEGGKKPTLTLKIKKDLKSATLDVKSAAGKTRQTLGPAEVGHDVVFELPQTQAGIVKWVGTLAVEFGDGSSGP